MSLKIIKKINLVFLAFFLLAIFGLMGLYIWLEKNNSPRSIGLGNLWTDLTGQFTSESRGYAQESPVESDENSGEFGNNQFSASPEVKVLASEKSFPMKPLLESAPQKKEIPQFTFVGIGDSESYDPPGYNEELSTILQVTSDKEPDFALFTGDIITTGAPTLEENQDRIAGAKNIIEEYYQDYYIAIGNHDIECGKDCSEIWQEVFFDKQDLAEELPLYYSFDYANTHFALLFTGYPDEKTVDEKQVEWLKKDLAGTDKPNKIVITHVPPVTFFEESAEDCHDMTCSGDISAQLVEIFQTNQVDLVISGHENAFDHKIVAGVDFVLSGNVGNSRKYDRALKGDIYTIFQVDGENISVQGIRLDKDGEDVLRDIKIK
jgi:Icc-related predicted phosphoesterase